MTSTGSLVAGRYLLQEQIAIGGAGEVWRAADPVLNRMVAVKLLRPEFVGDAEALARFRAEAQHAAQLVHPSIVQVYDYGRAGPAPFLVMELVDGPSLASVLAGGPLRPSWVLDMVGQVAAGLAVAHAAGLVHRDIKPGNLLLAPDGVVKITDFGIAHAAGAEPLTQTGTVPGTPGYLAPERVMGASATAASDLYSLGVVAWECLTGAPPFTGAPLEIAAAHVHRDLPPLPAGVPAAVAGLVAELTAKDPGARPASAAVLTRAGRSRAAVTVPKPRPAQPPRTLALPQITAPGPTPPRPGRGLGRRTRKVVLAVTGAAVTAGLAIALAAAIPGTTPPPPRTGTGATVTPTAPVTPSPVAPSPGHRHGHGHGGDGHGGGDQGD